MREGAYPTLTNRPLTLDPPKRALKPNGATEAEAEALRRHKRPGGLRLRCGGDGAGGAGGALLWVAPRPSPIGVQQGLGEVLGS